MNSGSHADARRGRDHPASLRRARGRADLAPDASPTWSTLVNALPSPVTLPCFLQALARPLKMHAAVSLISAQPSVGARSPRIFLFFDGLRVSIVPAGAGAPLLEMGEIATRVSARSRPRSCSR